MVFIDAFDKSGKVPPVLVDGQGTFLQSLNEVFQGFQGGGLRSPKKGGVDLEKMGRTLEHGCLRWVSV